MDTKFIVKHVFELQSKKLIVLTGHLLSGQIFERMCIVHREKKINIKSIEALNSKNASIALLFDEQINSDLDQLFLLRQNEIVSLIREA